jgi:hypothetical protein
VGEVVTLPRVGRPLPVGGGVVNIDGEEYAELPEGEPCRSEGEAWRTPCSLIRCAIKVPEVSDTMVGSVVVVVAVVATVAVVACGAQLQQGWIVGLNLQLHGGIN